MAPHDSSRSRPARGRSDLPAAQQARLHTTTNVSMLAVAAALLLIVLKAWAWRETGSVALLASMADSALDCAASVFTLLAVRYAATPPDAEHRFGHGKAESFAALFQAGLVAVSGLWVGTEAVQRLLEGAPPLQEGTAAIAVMAVSILVTGLLIVAQNQAIRRTGSVATKGDREHYAADFLSNGAAMIGIAAAAWLKIGWADAAAGLFVAGWLAFGAWRVAREAVDHLMDRELDEPARERIRALALSDPAVKGVHDLRSRTSGPLTHIQFHADLDPDLSLRAAHAIIVAAEARIRAEFPSADIIIHADPLDAKEPHGLFGDQHDGRRASG